MKLQVGDYVTVREDGWMPEDFSPKQKFKVIEVRYGSHCTIETTPIDGGWARERLGNGLYWNINKKYLIQIPRIIKVGGKLL